MDPFRGADKKLGDLMLRGWTMLADSCSVSNCKCPLMRSPDGQKYCVNCETWIYPNKNPEPKKFDELFSKNKEKKNLNEKKENKEIKKEEKKEEKKKEKKEEKEEKIIEINKDDNINDLIEKKLKKLAIQLNEENDINKCKDIVQLMNNILEFNSNYKNIQSKK